ncbi:Protoheme IX farnesyltransferase [Methylobacterium adhaesivum]|uniref:UbiA family prenyltransferase n=1 Tax=Methylobacterium adhaesivum TaxID=333297 RepID=A0ABT8BM12_9HYPH|nr:UbiA family prenyltransferase [Methylobacterium adhaesivum]MDN3593222.1 UbiA family prenyltransferase [Methylobacterium adhaesivum]GJD33035.1 Protoheme IX farnesyltransferase [Methylobacterium adhaesivum]
MRAQRLTVEAALPLVVDLDGTLIRSDLLIESFFAEIGGSPLAALALARAVPRGKAAIKHHLGTAALDVAKLPYDAAVLDVIAAARAEGRPVYLASASNAVLVEKVARHLGLFDGWFASDASVNLSGTAKADRLVATFGAGGFDYIGNHADDLPVWAKANRAVAVRLASAARRALVALAPEAVFLPETGQDLAARVRAWAKLLRVHQYAKNALVFVPLLMAHRFDGAAFLAAFLAFVAFSLCASSVYLINDLIDLEADRAHPTKRNRPLANGRVPLVEAMLAAPLLFVAALGVSLAVSAAFCGVLLAYFALTTAYSFSLKRKMLVDVVTLAALYTIRVVGGGVAVGAVLSDWLLAFSLFMFMSLALIKRYTELTSRLDRGLPSPTNRNYELSDLPIVASLAAAAGYNAVVVLALYLSSDAVTQLYSRPKLLWCVGPVILYWISRALLMAHRRMMHDDPIVFALRDRVSLVTAATVGILVLAAI